MCVNWLYSPTKTNDRADLLVGIIPTIILVFLAWLTWYKFRFIEKRFDRLEGWLQSDTDIDRRTISQFTEAEDTMSVLGLNRMTSRSAMLRRTSRLQPLDADTYQRL